MSEGKNQVTITLTKEDAAEIKAFLSQPTGVMIADDNSWAGVCALRKLAKQLG